MDRNIVLYNMNELVTCAGGPKAGKDMNEIGLVKNGVVVVEDGVIRKVGTRDEISLSDYEGKGYELIDCDGKTVLPGFVDSHTHLVFGGYRADEYSWRLAGESYVSIMEKGGGIINSVKGTADATDEELMEVGLKRLDSMTAFGVTTVEAKSGYGLFKDTELKQLRVAKALDEIHPLDIVSTFLGAHSVPKEYKAMEDGAMKFVDYLIEEVMPIVAQEELAEFCDVFCEKNVFSVEESRKLLLKAKEYGMKLKLHADEIVQLGGAELAAELGAVSADHLLQASDEGIKRMAETGVVTTLLPVTAFSLKEHFARGRYMIDNGCYLALATDFNPGSCFSESIPLVIALATLQIGLTIEEMVTALTINAAKAVGRENTIGSIEVGKKADLVVHEFPSYKFLPYHIGVSTVERVFKEGRLIYDKRDLKVARN